jgi:glutathione S-transferase
MFFVRQAQIACDEVLWPLGTVEFHSNVSRISPAGKVPALELDSGEVIADSLAIGHTLHELFPDKKVFPQEGEARRAAYAACAEMHSGFTEMRRVLTMNARARFAKDAWKIAAGDTLSRALVTKDIDRAFALWTSLLERFGGEFLCGSFGYVDAFFVPVVSRFRSYAIDLPPLCERYAARIEALPTYVQWMHESKNEPQVIEKYEFNIPKR